MHANSPRPPVYQRKRHRRKHAHQQQPERLHRRHPQLESRRRKKILRRAAHHVADPRVPVDAHRESRLRGARPQSRFLHQFPQLHVVNHFHGQPPVCPHGFVRAAADHLESPDAHVAPRARVHRAPRPRPHHHRQPEKRHGDLFPERIHLGRAQQRHVIPSPLLGQRQRPPQESGREMDVRIREDQPFAARLFVGLLQRVRFSQPPGGQGIDARVFQPRILPRGAGQDRSRGVFGAVIHGHHFVTRVIERQKGFQCAR